MKLTPEKLTAFCAALAETGIVRKACDAVGIARQTAYEWRSEIPEFAAAWDKALEIGITALEDEVHRRAFEGVDEGVYHQGVLMDTQKKYSDTLAIFLLKAHKPEKYRERSHVDLANSDGTLAPVDETAKAARVAQLIAMAQQRKTEQDALGGLA